MSMKKASDVRRPKGVPIQLEGETYHLRFDLNAFAELEDLYGDIEEAMNAMENGSIKAIRAVLWAGLLHDHVDEDGNPTITARKVGSMIDLSELGEISEGLADAMKRSLPKEAVEELDREMRMVDPLDKKKSK